MSSTDFSANKNEQHSAQQSPAQIANEICDKNVSPRRILVISLDWPQTADLVVALHDVGFVVTLIMPARLDEFGLGGYCEQIVSPSVESPEYPQFVADHIFSIGPEIVLPVCEPIMALLWEDRFAMCPVYPRPTEWQRDLLKDRRKLYAHAAELNIRIPKWFELRSDSDLNRAIEELSMPLVIRGTQGFGGDQVRIVSNPTQITAVVTELRRISSGPLFVQEFVEGQRCLYGALLAQGEVQQYFSQETLETYPASTSPSIRVRSLDDPRLSASAIALFKSLRLDGLACAEFIKARPGHYVLLEVNPRPWAAIRAAQYCGVDLLAGFAACLSGTEPPVNKFRVGVENVMFPQFLAARLHAGKLPTFREMASYFRCLHAAPWNRPRLFFHLLRRTWREWQMVSSFRRAQERFQNHHEKNSL